MKIKLIKLNTLILIACIFLMNVSTIKSVKVINNIDYNVNIGDVMEYQYINLQFMNKSEYNYTITKEDLNTSIITLKEGSSFKMEVTNISSAGIRGKITYLPSITSIEEMIGPAIEIRYTPTYSVYFSLSYSIIKTTNNRSYWEGFT